MLDLDDAEFELDGCRIRYVKTVSNDKPEVRDQDADMPREDGVRFGRDRLGGGKVTLEGNIAEDDKDAAHAVYADMLRAWSGNNVRTRPGAVLALRGKWPGQNVRRCYGRPRKFAPTIDSRQSVGLIPFVADFQASDPLWYSDAASTLELGIAGPTQPGFSTPLTPPITTEAPATVPGKITVDGETSTWPVVTFHGPVRRPKLTVRGQWEVELDAELVYDQSVTIDPRPWARTVLRNDNASLAGKLTRASVKLSAMTLPPGQHTFQFEGSDETATATVGLSWRAAYRTL
jgi:hypothetical protein